MNTPNFQKIFEGCEEGFLVLEPNSPTFTIVAVSDVYLQMTHTVREQIIGRGLFEVFPDNPADKNADGVANLTASLNRVLNTKAVDHMHLQKYDIREAPYDPLFEERYWIPRNSPILDDDGNVLYILHHVSDATQQESLIHRFGGEGALDKNVSALTQIERLNNIMVSRELRMMELKKKLAECEETPKTHPS